MYESLVIDSLRDLQDPDRAARLQKFFKTGKGEYGEGDIFWGVPVPRQRSVAMMFQDISLEDIAILLKSPVHEQRLTALFILVERYRYVQHIHDLEWLKVIIDFYLQHFPYINNWDLVDASAPCILGEYCLLKDDFSILSQLAHSNNLWEKRIAMVGMLIPIRKGRFPEALTIATVLLKDSHDLIHKAVGWMLREIGKKNVHILRKFLDKHAQTMPRTMLRYAVEKMDAQERRKYMT